MRKTAAVLMAWACAGGMVFAQDESGRAAHEVLLRDMRVAVGTVIRADADGIEWVEESGARRRASAGEALGFAPRMEAMVSAQAPLPIMGVVAGATGLVELADGQRYPGQRLLDAGVTERLAWRHPMFGRMSFALEDVRRVGFDTPARERIERSAWSGGTRDEAWLANGDVIEGFLIGMGERVELQTDAGVSAAPIERVSGLAISGRPTTTRGVRYWLEDGTVVSVESAASAGGSWINVTLRGGATARVPMNTVRAMVMDAGVVVPLSGLAAPMVDPIGARSVLDGVRVLPAASTPAWNAYDLEMGGPSRATWEMPAGALKFCATVEMPLATRPWGDCEVAVLVDGVEAWRGTLSEGEPRARIGVNAPGRRLTVEVRPGAYGAVNDRPVLRRAIVVVSEPEA